MCEDVHINERSPLEVDSMKGFTVVFHDGSYLLTTARTSSEAKANACRRARRSFRDVLTVKREYRGVA